MMNTESPNINKPSPPPEKPTETTGKETAHTDAGPIEDEITNRRDWNNLEDEATNGRDWNNAEDRYEMIAEAAYYKAEQRGFAVGDEELDWLEAEQELLEKMAEESVH